MLVELRAKSQITLPKAIVTSLSLSEGDKLDIVEKNGMIYMIPVTIYPTEYITELRKEINMVKENISYGEQPVFDNIDALFEKLDEK